MLLNKRISLFQKQQKVEIKLCDTYQQIKWYIPCMNPTHTHIYIYIWEKNIIPVLYGAATSTNRNREKCCGFGVLMASQLKISLKSVGDGFYDELAVHNKHKWMVNFFCFFSHKTSLVIVVILFFALSFSGNWLWNEDGAWCMCSTLLIVSTQCLSC